MSEKYQAKTARLSFKGDPNALKKKKKKRKSKSEEHGEEEKQDGWVNLQSASELGGPLYLIFSSEPPTCLSLDDKGNLVMIPVDSPEEDDNDEDDRGHRQVSIQTAAPTTIYQVFVVARIPGATDRFSLKTHAGRYLSSDKFGVVTAQAEAIGMQEEWMIVVRDDHGLALQNHYGKFLSIDEVATTSKSTSSSSSSSSPSKFQIRADAETIGFCESFTAKIQARFRQKASASKGKAKEGAHSKEDSSLEYEQTRKYQTWSHGRVVVSERNVHELKRARVEGRLNEALLDRREKVKSDRYCK
ncbi:hypothetical protein BGZ73_002868 [Actinomortierella ambigua]|nr:hypothetical protein BGZ73_002868 [Actinomortierella ambigua]